LFFFPIYPLTPLPLDDGQKAFLEEVKIKPFSTVSSPILKAVSSSPFYIIKCP
jgi:hypothetical protein